MMNANLTFWLEREVAADGLMKISVHAQGVPVNLFGVSFHLKVVGDDWSYDHSETGNILGATPMSLVKRDGDMLVTGVSLRRGDELRSRDGELISFFVKADEISEVGFENGVVSVFEDGRKDLEGVVWDGVREQQVSFDEVLDVVKADESVDSILYSQSEVKSQVEVRGFEDGQVSVMRYDTPLIDIYLFLGLVFIVLMFVFGGWLVFKYKYEIRSFFGKKRRL